MYALKLLVKPGNWQMFSSRNADPAFVSFKKKVHERDWYTCQFCGFQAQEHQEVLNLDGNYKNNRLGNLVTACPLCAQCHFLDAMGISYGGGKLVVIPEMTQNDLNSFCHVLFCAMTNKTGYIETAQTVYRNLRTRSQQVEEKFGENSSDPAVFCQLLLNSEVEYEKENLFESVRVLPTFAKFKEQLDDWAAAAVKELSQE